MKLTLKKKADFLLFITAIGWALSTILIKLYTQELPVFHIMFGRYLIAFITVAIIWHKKLKNISKKDLKSGSILGVFVFLAFTFAIMSLSYTSASKSGFFVAMSVLFVPIVTAILRRRLPNKWIVMSVLISIVGLYLVAGINGDAFNKGDILALLCAAAYTVYIMLLDKYAKDIDEAQLVLIQLGVVTLISFVAMMALEGFHFNLIIDHFWPLLATGVLGTAITNFAQTKAQQHASPESVGLILLGEPIFTLLLAVMILNETVMLKGMMGVVLLLSAMVITVLKDV
jgi:drug/metabolite transporter (DMT)-like permease